mgnify:CR=1 FL=1
MCATDLASRRRAAERLGPLKAEALREHSESLELLETVDPCAGAGLGPGPRSMCQASRRLAAERLGPLKAEALREHSESLELLETVDPRGRAGLGPGPRSQCKASHKLS